MDKAKRRCPDGLASLVAFSTAGAYAAGPTPAGENCQDSVNCNATVTVHGTPVATVGHQPSPVTIEATDPASVAAPAVAELNSAVNVASAVAAEPSVPVAASMTPCTAVTPCDFGAYDVELDGDIQVQPDGGVTGVLPPGYTAATVPEDPDDPGLRAKIASSPDTSGLLTWDQAVRSGIALSSPRSGCVYAYSGIFSYGFLYSAAMKGCRQGYLYLHTYVNYDGHRIQDGETPLGGQDGFWGGGLRRLGPGG